MTLQPRMLENLDESSDEDEFFGDESIDQKMGSGLAAETIILQTTLNNSESIKLQKDSSLLSKTARSVHPDELKLQDAIKP